MLHISVNVGSSFPIQLKEPETIQDAIEHLLKATMQSMQRSTKVGRRPT